MLNQDLDVLLLGNHEAAQMGLSVKQLQLSIVIISLHCVATLVSKSGCSRFYRTHNPHLARIIIVAPKHRNTLLFSVLIGSIDMIWSMSRALHSPEEIPIGVLVLTRAPLFIWIIMNRYKQWLVYIISIEILCIKLIIVLLLYEEEKVLKNYFCNIS